MHGHHHQWRCRSGRGVSWQWHPVLDRGFSAENIDQSAPIANATEYLTGTLSLLVSAASTGFGWILSPRLLHRNRLSITLIEASTKECHDAGKIITIVVFTFVTLTYGSWFIASFYDWGHGSEHGCLRLRVSPTEVKANIESDRRESGGRIETIITEGVPILFWVGNAIFSIDDESRKHDGFVKMNLGFSELEMTFSYSGDEPFTETIRYKRVTACNVDNTVYAH